MPKRNYSTAFGNMPRSSKRARYYRRKRYAARRAYYRKKAYYRRRYRRGTTVTVSKPDYITKAIHNGQIDVQATTTDPTSRFGAFIFRLSDCNCYDAWRKLYDQYRIKKVKIYFYTQNIELGNQDGLLMLKTDYDDNTGIQPANLMADPKTCIYRLNEQRFVNNTCYPRASTNVYGATNDQHGIQPRQTWLDCGYPGVVHYGVKWAVDNETPANTKITWRCMYTLEFRGQRCST